MLKQAFRSYMASLHPGNYRKVKDKSISLTWIYWLIINPTLHDWGFDGGATEHISFYIVNLTPYFLMWWSNLGQKLYMPKQMYLLPMTASEKTEYISYLLMIKIGFPTMIVAILHVIRGCIYGIELFRIFACTLAVFSFGIGMYVCSTLRSKFDRYIQYAVRGEDGTGKDAFLNWMCMIYAAIYHFIASAAEISVAEGESIWGVAFFYLAPLMIMIIMDIAILKTCYKGTIIDAWNYEESFQVLGKVKN